MGVERSAPQRAASRLYSDPRSTDLRVTSHGSASRVVFVVPVVVAMFCTYLFSPPTVYENIARDADPWEKPRHECFAGRVGKILTVWAVISGRTCHGRVPKGAVESRERSERTPRKKKR